MPQQSIPVLDLTHFTAAGPEGQAFVRRLGDALREFGFFTLVNHGVEQELIRRAYAAVEAFFMLPEPAKRGYERRELKGQRGFTSFGREHAKDHPVPDLKEFWHVGRDRFMPNVWPEEIADFQAALAELYRQLDRCSLTLLEAVALYLGEERGLIRDMAEEGNTILRVIHYPPVPENAPPASLRAAPHEDINLITLLCEATASGLEIKTREGEWLPVQAAPGQIVVDAGDMLQNLTNGALKSTTHQVANPSDSRERRFSMPFFVHPRSEVSLAPLPSCVEAAGGERRYPEITAGEYLEQRLREIGLA